MDLLSILLGSMTSDSSVKSLSKKTGSSKKQIKLLIALAIPLLITYLTKNASQKEGATSLLNALTQHTDTSNMSNQISSADEADGAAILSHILGNNSSSVMSGLSQQTGMSSSQVQQALSSLAPALLSGLSAATTQAQQAQSQSSSLDLSSLLGMFGGSSSASSSSNSGMGLLSSLLGSTTSSKPQSGGFLASLFGGGSSSSSSSNTGMSMLSSLLGGSSDESVLSGSSLLSSLLSLGN